MAQSGSTSSLLAAQGDTSFVMTMVPGSPRTHLASPPTRPRRDMAPDEDFLNLPSAPAAHRGVRASGSKGGYIQLADGPTESSPLPKDKLRLVYFTFFLQGLSMLVPWNMFITAEPYYRHRFAGTPHQDNFENVITVASVGSTALGITAAVHYAKGFNMRFSVALPTALNIAILLANSVMVLADKLDAELVFYLTVLSVIICGANTALMQFGIFGLAGRFPLPITQAVMAGQGLAGISVSALSVLTTLGESASSTKPLDPDEVKQTAFVYFFVATVVVAIALVAFSLMSRLRFAMHYAFLHEAEVQRLNRTILDSPVHSPHSGNHSPQSTPPRDFFPPQTSISGASLDGIGRAGGGLVDESNSAVSDFVVIRFIWAEGLSVLMVFCTTLCVFPAVTSQIRSMQNPQNSPLPAAGRFFGDLWVPLSFLNFNVCDTLGRVLASWYVLQPSAAKLMAAARLALIPLLLACNVITSAAGSIVAGSLPAYEAGHVVLDNDAWPLGLVALLGLSNGYAASCIMMRAPKAVPDERLASQAGTLMVLFLQFGLFLGASSSFAVRGYLCACNPLQS
eukprot:TRINITY_DN46499_c0_g1_i1.p1 TRINITY_DN46499_c0_g1~~TRINITY_DN46499_c0_g1_i1.p1  ORF type:complete len:567 (+),score=65.43 TRINITY_DN46499_c0_g1_i1:141-1841(+)